MHISYSHNAYRLYFSKHTNFRRISWKDFRRSFGQSLENRIQLYLYNKENTEYENKYEKAVECDVQIADSKNNYSSLKLPKTNIVEDLPEDCYTDSHRLSMLTIRMIQEEMI